MHARPAADLLAELSPQLPAAAAPLRAAIAWDHQPLAAPSSQASGATQLYMQAAIYIKDEATVEDFRRWCLVRRPDWPRPSPSLVPPNWPSLPSPPPRTPKLARPPTPGIGTAYSLLPSPGLVYPLSSCY